MTIWVFGDSWPYGAELESRNFAFPVLIGQTLNVPVQNMALQGTSQETMIEQFFESTITDGDIVIFCCTTKTRRVYRTKENNLLEVQFTVDEQYCNPYEDERKSAQTCALLYFMTKARNAIPYFINLFDTTVLNERMWQEVPDASWIIEKDKSILSKLFDPEYFSRWNNHTTGDFAYWLKDNNEFCKKYIRPCGAHPNKQGHQLIADFIVGRLTENGHFI